MFRKLILATGTSTGFSAVPGAADAHPPAAAHRHGFDVLHRHGGRWEFHGRYHDRSEARRFAVSHRHR
jgi:hypothetical protein